VLKWDRTAILEAVKAGVDSIEHGSFLDEEGIELMRKKGTFLVPTLFISDYFMQNAKEGGPLAKMLDIEKK
jgi:imidazolonepropionase-like amidohydrolase